MAEGDNMCGWCVELGLRASRCNASFSGVWCRRSFGGGIYNRLLRAGGLDLNGGSDGFYFAAPFEWLGHPKRVVCDYGAFRAGTGTSYDNWYAGHRGYRLGNFQFMLRWT